IPDIQLNEKGPVRKKENLLNYIYGLEGFVVNEKQIKEFYQKINSIKEFFKDVLHADTLIKAIELNKKYFFEEFQHSYTQLSNIFPPNEIRNRILEKEGYIEKRYKNIISNLHSMEGFTLDIIKSFIINANYSYYLDADFFYLGIPVNISRKKDGFYF